MKYFIPILEMKLLRLKFINLAGMWHKWDLSLSDTEVGASQLLCVCVCVCMYREGREIVLPKPQEWAAHCLMGTAGIHSHF